MPKFTYKKKHGEFVIYKDGAVMKTPNGAIVKTNDQTFANKLITTLPDYTSPKSLLTYHYTYCNLKERYTKVQLIEMFSNHAKKEILMDDEYLMFRQSSPIKEPIAEVFESQLGDLFTQLNMYQLSAIFVTNYVFNSWMLPYYIISDIIIPMQENDGSDFKTLKEDFLNDLEEYEKDEFIYYTGENGELDHREDLSLIIEAFVQYFMFSIILENQ